MDITDDEARWLWAVSEDGGAQIAAAWGAACRLGLDGYGLTRADVGSLLWAAHTVSHPGPRDDPRKTRMLELITERGEAGMTVREVAIAIYAKTGSAVAREALHRWAGEFERDRLLERADPPRPGHWVAVRHEAKPPDGLQDDPRHVRMLQLITDAGQDGTTLGEVMRQLAAEFGIITREAVQGWAVQDAATGLLEQFDGQAKGMWRAVQP